MLPVQSVPTWAISTIVIKYVHKLQPLLEKWPSRQVTPCVERVGQTHVYDKDRWQNIHPSHREKDIHVNSGVIRGSRTERRRKEGLPTATRAVLRLRGKLPVADLCASALPGQQRMAGIRQFLTYIVTEAPYRNPCQATSHVNCVNTALTRNFNLDEELTHYCAEFHGLLLWAYLLSPHWDSFSLGELRTTRFVTDFT